MSTKVKIKFKDKGKKISKAEVKSLACNEIGVPFVRLYEIPEGYKALCKNDEEVDKLLSKDAENVFESKGLIVITPPEIRARRSFFIRKMDEDVGKHTAAQFGYEIEHKNPGISVAEVTKIRDYTHVIKIECTETSMVDRVLTTGLKIFNTSILPEQITREEFISLLTCFNCYQYEEHTTFNCPEKNVKYCSECGGEGHKFFECKEIEKKCLNCKRNNENSIDHRTLAMSCPLKKKLIKEKREMKKAAEEEKQNKTYAMVAKKTAQEVIGEKIEINLSEVTHFKILASIMHAHVLNLQTPGCYKTELNQMLEQNGLPQMWFPDNPDSATVLGSKRTTEDRTKSAGAMAMDQPKPKAQRKQTRQASVETEEDSQYPENRRRDPRIQTKPQGRELPEQDLQHPGGESGRPNEGLTTESEPPPRPPKDAEELGMTIYITNKQNFPTKHPRRSDIVHGIDNRTHKYVYENKHYEESYVEFLIRTEKLEITKDDFKLVDVGKFKKIRNGPSRGSPTQTVGHRKTFKDGGY